MNDTQHASIAEDSSLGAVARELVVLEQELRALEAEMGPAIASVPASHGESARNLVHYVALRQRDLRDLQEQLSRYGLSSLGRSESHVLGGLLETSLRAHESLSVRHGGSSAELERLTQASALSMSWETALAPTPLQPPAAVPALAPTPLEPNEPASPPGVLSTADCPPQATTSPTRAKATPKFTLGDALFGFMSSDTASRIRP